MLKKTHTSLEFSKWLHEKGFRKPAKYAHDTKRNRIMDIDTLTSDFTREETMETMKLYYAYDILNDLCNTYAKELFGEEATQEVDVPAYISVSENILYLMREGKKEVAEQHFKDNCIL